MSKYYFVLAILLIACLNAFSQKESTLSEPIYTDIKVETLKGFELRIIPYANGLFYSHQAGYSMNKPFSLSAYVGYFKEKRIDSKWTLLMSAGLHNIVNQSPVLRSIYDPVNHFNTRLGPDTKMNYSLVVEVGVEPRWHPGTKEWNQAGGTQLNSGWFITFPLLFQTLILHTPEPYIRMGWFPSVMYSGSFLLTPTAGYRIALSKKWFVEGSIGFGANVTVATNSVDNRFTVLKPEYNPAFKLKAAYLL